MSVHRNIKLSWTPKPSEIDAYLMADGWMNLGGDDKGEVVKYAREGTYARVPQNPNADDYADKLRNAMLAVGLFYGWRVDLDTGSMRGSSQTAKKQDGNARDGGHHPASCVSGSRTISKGLSVLLVAMRQVRQFLAAARR